MSIKTSSSLDLLPDRLRGRLIISAADLADIIGWHPQSISRACRRGTFPIPSSLVRGSYAFRVHDVLDYVDSIGQPAKPKRGRPRKTEVVAAGVQS